jgi:hypothetical protein
MALAIIGGISPRGFTWLGVDEAGVAADSERHEADGPLLPGRCGQGGGTLLSLFFGRGPCGRGDSKVATP